MRDLRGICMIVGLTLFVFLGTANAGQFGAPEPVANDRSFSLGAGYFYNADKWRLSSNSQDYKYSQNQGFLQLSVASNGVEFYARGGYSNLNFENAFPNADFNDIYKPFGAIGLRGVIDITKSIGIGLFGQGNWFWTYKSQNVEIKDMSDYDLGLVLQGKINRICIYAGPFAYWTHAKTESNTLGSSSLNQKSNIGGVAGIRIPIYKGFNFEIEGQAKQEFSGGGFLSYSF